MKKNLSGIVISCIVMIVLGGCGKESETGLEEMQLSIVSVEEDGEQNDADGDQNDADGEQNNVSESRQADDSQPEAGDISCEGGQSTDSERAAALEAYITILEDIFFDQKFPGDQDYGYQPMQEYDVATNQFAVYDIDGDGKEELLITYSTTYTAGQGELVYGFDSAAGTVTEELRAYPLLTYYDNGVVEEKMSHNHGMAADGDFWPYILYQYDAQTDQYTVIASVDAWSRTYREEDYDGNPFPEEVDDDGDGMVYYTMEGGTYALENPLDGNEYQLWRDSYLKGAQPVKVPYVKLTPDNIYALGAGISESGQNSP